MPKAKQDLVEQARDDLHRARQHLETLLSGEDDALATTQTYGTWQRDVASAKAEVSRLTKLAIKADADAKLQAEAAARAAQERLEADYEVAADKAAKLIADNLNQLAAIARETAKLIASSEEMRLAVQAGRATDLPALISAETRARGAGGLPEKIISETVDEYWTYVETGHRLSADLARQVVPMPGGSEGRLPARGSMSTKGSSAVVKQSFTKRVYHPAASAPPSHSIVASMMIPAAKAGGQPGWAPCAENPATIRAALATLSKPTERETRVEYLRADQESTAAA